MKLKNWVSRSRAVQLIALGASKITRARELGADTFFSSTALKIRRKSNQPVGLKGWALGRTVVNGGNHAI